jgi:cyclase
VSAPTVITPDDVLEPRLEDVGGGLYAYLQLYGQWGLNNAAFIVGSERVVVIDTAFTVNRAKAFREQIDRVTGKPCATLLNTHHHGDHTHGNFLFPEATIIGHRLCRQAMLDAGLGTTDMFQEGVDWGDIRIDPPFVTFDDQLTVHVGDLTLEAHFVGPAHTSNDVVFYVPQRRLLFAGDLAFSGGTPFALMGSVHGSLDAYRRLADLDVETVIPGHGPICGPEVLDDMARYLAMVREVAGEADRTGTPPLQAARETDLGDYAGWHDTERIVGNLHRALAELHGVPPGDDVIDLAQGLHDMQTYNGGQPLHCRA